MIRATVAAGCLAACLGCGQSSPTARDQTPVPATPSGAARGDTPTPPTPSRESLAKRSPDFVITPGQMARDWKADYRTAGAKYQGKLVEVTGWVLKVADSDPVGTGRLAVFDENADDVGILDSLISCTFTPSDAAKYQRLEALAQGQRVKFRGVGIDPSHGRGLVDCEFLEVGPSTAIPCTVAGLYAAFEKSPADAAAKYTRKTLVCRVKVVSAETESIGTRWQVTDPDGDGTQKLSVFISSLARDASRVREINGVRPGQTVLVIAQSDPVDRPLRLTNVRLLQQPPDGVELPTGKR